MEINRKALDSLLSLDDRTLMNIITRLAKEGGFNPSDFNINPRDISSIRNAISGATDADLAKIAEQFQNKKK